MKDVTSTSLGYLVAFLIPGFVGLYALTFWSDRARLVFQSFRTAESTIGLFLLVSMAALVLGLQISAVSALVFQRGVCRKFRLAGADSKALAEEGKLAAFRAAVDEHYRYHQFWSGMCLVLPVAYCGWLKGIWDMKGGCQLGLSMCVFLAVEALNVREAIVSWRSFVTRAEFILRSPDVQRMARSS